MRVVCESSNLFKTTPPAFSRHSGCFPEMPTQREQDGYKTVVAGASFHTVVLVPYSSWLSRHLGMEIASWWGVCVTVSSPKSSSPVNTANYQLIKHISWVYYFEPSFQLCCKIKADAILRSYYCQGPASPAAPA